MFYYCLPGPVRSVESGAQSGARSSPDDVERYVSCEPLPAGMLNAPNLHTIPMFVMCHFVCIILGNGSAILFPSALTWFLPVC